MECGGLPPAISPSPLVGEKNKMPSPLVGEGWGEGEIQPNNHLNAKQTAGS